MPPTTAETLLVLNDAPASASPTAGFIQTLPLLLAILAIFYFLMIRPQQKQLKEHQTLLSSLKKDDQVVTTAGIHGRIWAVEDNAVVLEIGKDLRVKFDKSAVRRKLSSSGTEIVVDDKKSKKGA